MSKRAAIFVTGLPASGKTSVGRKLSIAFDWPLLDKDEFLERLYDQYPVENLEDRNRLSRLSDEQFIGAAKQEQSVVLVSHWAPKGETGGSGTPTDWLSEVFDPLIEVHCVCSVTTATERFLNRKRHPGHMDAVRSTSEIRRKMEKWALGLPLGFDAMVEIDTEADVSTETLVAAINMLLIET